MLQLAASETQKRREQDAHSVRHQKSLADLTAAYERLLADERQKNAAADDEINKKIEAIVAGQDARISTAVTAELAKRFTTPEQTKTISKREAQSHTGLNALVATLIPVIVTVLPLLLDHCNQTTRAQTPTKSVSSGAP